MAKTKTVFFCTDCGNDTPRWAGQCPACKAWNTLTEGPTPKAGGKRALGASVHGWSATPAAVVHLDDVEEKGTERFASGIQELDYVLGGGIVPGSIVLIGGEPGIGKSTLTLQMLGSLQGRDTPVLYVSGEESATQIKMRAKRLGGGAERVAYLGEPNLDSILEHIKARAPQVALIDSIQTIFTSNIDGAPGGVGQLRECAAQLQRFAKETQIAIFIIGHVTKDGSIAGPRTLEHIVDTVIYFEAAGEEDYRVLRATKNRFGSLDEIGVFRMTGEGLEGVPNPSEIFLSQRRAGSPGSAVVPLMGGSRPLLVEIQGLGTAAAYGNPQRVSNGFDPKRLALLLAVLEKRARYPFRQADVFLNVVGGLRIEETAADTAVAVALASSLTDRPVPRDAVFLGEVGLGGELRSVSQIERRISEAARMGFTTAYVPKGSAPRNSPMGIQVVGIDDINELLTRTIGDFESIARQQG